MSWNFGFQFGGHPGAKQDGLPFAGVPPELEQRVERMLVDEPPAPSGEAAAAAFRHHGHDRRPLTMRGLLRPHRWAFIGAFVLVVAETATMQIGPLLTQLGIDHGIRAADAGVLVAVSIAYLVSVLVNMLAAWIRTAWTGRLGERVMLELRVRIFSHLQRLSVGFFTNEKAGVLMTRMTSDLEALGMLLREGMLQLALQALTLLFVTAVMFAMDVRLAAMTVLAVVPVMVALSVWFRRESDRGYGLVRDRIADVLSHLQESLAGVRIVTSFNRQRHNLVEHANVAGDYRAANDDTARVNATYTSGTEAVGIVGQAVVLLVGGRMVLNGDLTVGQLTAFVLYVTSFFAPIQQMAQLYDTYQRARAALTKLRDLMLTEPEVPERPDAVVMPPIRGEVRFEGVSFAYQPGRPVLSDVDLSIAEGETFALVGPTGAGKSTLAKLVTRFYDPVEGRVLIDGHDLRDVTVSSLRGQLGIVPQEPFLFDGTVRDNVAFARPDAGDEEVEAACRAVGIDDLIERLPEGVDTRVHERGVSLSAGERQLLALARAFLARPRVLVLDEATSNLDLRSEARIEHALDVVLEGRTAIIIAHRLATAMRADRIAVVDGGRIVELGSHDELVAQGGAYAEMFWTWTRHAQPAAPSR